uniref:G_PROTEIN_RECEP_F1_2 domain-containing protein n=1 Tax=Rhabditophanes sp. KR3021 TaxID=114890 RepID=A0AC35TXP5_9BILA
MFAANLSDTTSMSVLATLPLNEVDSEVPSPLLSDYIEMSYLALVLLIGVPLNIKVLLNLFHSLNDRNLQNSAKAQRRFTLLKIHLNISDLGILLINALGKMVWLFSYQWFGGDLMCRIFNFLNMFTLYLSSNIIVIIALDRLRNVLHAKQIRNPVVDLMVIKQLILTAYILALFWSLPQLYVWEVQNIFPDVPGGWYQCTDVWSLRKRFETIYALRTSYIDQVMFMNNSELIYNISHLVLVFWGPITILLVAYAIIAVKVIHYSLSVPGRAQQQLTCRPNVDTEQSTACVGESALESGGRLNDNDGSKDIVDRLDLEKSARRSTFPFTRQLKETLTTETENLLSTTDKPAPTEPDTTSLPSRRGFKSYSKNIPSLISGIFTKGSSKILSTNNSKFLKIKSNPLDES